MATRSPHKRKKAAKEFEEASAGVGGPAGTIGVGSNKILGQFSGFMKGGKLTSVIKHNTGGGHTILPSRLVPTTKKAANKAMTAFKKKGKVPKFDGE
jgi:hypothetical protein